MNNDKASGNLNLKNVNIGSGTHLIVKDYLHLDEMYDRGFISQYNNFKDIGIYKCDLMNEFPPLRNIENIYTCHLLEHLSIDNGYSLIKNCFNSLNTGGTIRICVPDFEIWQNALKKKDKKFFDFYRSQMSYSVSDVYKNDFAFFTTVIYGHGHKMIYTYDFLASLLEEIGFTDIKRMTWGDSSLPNIDILEAKDNLSRIKESLIIEAKKK